jgi:hypothetical protein
MNDVVNEPLGSPKIRALSLRVRSYTPWYTGRFASAKKYKTKTTDEKAAVTRETAAFGHEFAARPIQQPVGSLFQQGDLKKELAIPLKGDINRSD